MKLSFGMVGGGNGAFIGNVHRRGAYADGLAVLKAGCFSRNPEKNREMAAAWDVDTAWGRSIYKRRFNFSDAVYLCCQVLRGRFLDVPPFLERKLLPYRPIRRYPRTIIAGNRISPPYLSAR